MNNLKIELLIAALVLLIFVILMLKKNSLTIKYSVMWLLLPIVFVGLVIFSEPLHALSSFLGFEVLSNFVFFVILGCLLLFCFLLTIIVSRQKNRITKLIQEISILRKEIDDKKGK